MKYQIIFSSEHETNYIPKEYAPFFRNKDTILKTHRGWDIGIPVVVKHFEKLFQVSATKAIASRLLIDLNRSPRHKNLFSEFTKSLPDQDLEIIQRNFYYPHRNQVESQVVAAINSGKTALHIAFHSFTPELNGELRNASIGILYDPSHRIESEFSREWKRNLQSIQSTYKIRSNYPYKGISDSLPTYLRKKYTKNYIGIELELNQGLFQKDGNRLKDDNLLTILSDSFRMTLGF